MPITARAKWEAEIEKTRLSITITMPVEDWRDHMRQMPTSYPGWKVSQLIAAAIGEAVGRVDNLKAEMEIEQ